MAIKNPTVLPDDPKESFDTAKKFTNIDSEPFQFNWDSKPFGGTLGNKEEIKSGETVIMPKYLVRYAALHLAKKIVKREGIEEKRKHPLYKKHGEEFIKNIGYTIRNPAREKELIKEMIAKNFEEEPKIVSPEPKVVPEPSVEKAEEKKFKCDFPGCDFSTNVKIALLGHQRKHKK